MKPPCMECELYRESKNNRRCFKCEARERYWTEIDDRVPTQDWNFALPAYIPRYSRRAAE